MADMTGFAFPPNNRHDVGGEELPCRIGSLHLTTPRVSLPLSLILCTAVRLFSAYHSRSTRAQHQLAFSKGERRRYDSNGNARNIPLWRLLILAILTTLAGCSTVPKTSATKPVCVACQLQNQARIHDSQRRTVQGGARAFPTSLPVDLWTRRFSVEKHKSFQVQLDRAQDYVVPCQEIFRRQGCRKIWFMLPWWKAALPRPHAHMPYAVSACFSLSKRRASATGWNRTNGSTERRHPFKARPGCRRISLLLYDSFGSWPLVLAAYNCGEKAVQAALDQSKLQSFWELAQSGYLPSETREYVPKVLATIKIVRDTKLYGFHFNPQHYTPKHENRFRSSRSKTGMDRKTDGGPGVLLAHLQSRALPGCHAAG